MKLSARCCPSLILSLLVFTSASPASPPLSIKVLGPMQGDHSANTVLWVPDMKPGLPHDASALVFTRAYLDAWPRLAAKAKNSEELVTLVKQTFPDAVDPNGDFSLRTSARVAKGEEPKWDE